MSIFTLQWWNWIIATKTIWLAKLKIISILPFIVSLLNFVLVKLKIGKWGILSLFILFISLLHIKFQRLCSSSPVEAPSLARYLQLQLPSVQFCGDYLIATIKIIFDEEGKQVNWTWILEAITLRNWKNNHKILCAKSLDLFWGIVGPTCQFSTGFHRPYFN